jgi:hypothetical protein
VYILIVEAIERQKTGVEYAEVNGITGYQHVTPTGAHQLFACKIAPTQGESASQITHKRMRNATPK